MRQYSLVWGCRLGFEGSSVVTGLKPDRKKMSKREVVYTRCYALIPTEFFVWTNECFFEANQNYSFIIRTRSYILLSLAVRKNSPGSPYRQRRWEGWINCLMRWGNIDARRRLSIWIPRMVIQYEVWKLKVNGLFRSVERHPDYENAFRMFHLSTPINKCPIRRELSSGIYR